MSQLSLHPDDFDFWQRRAEIAVARLIKHGFVAAASVETGTGADGRPTRKMSVYREVRIDVILLEIVAQYLDIEQNQVDKVVIEELLRTSQADDDGD